MARKSKYTTDTITTLLDCLGDGMYEKDACAIAGISEDTFERWQKRYADFAEAVTRAKPKGWQAALATIRAEAIKGDWRAAGEYLDRTGSPYRKSTEVNVNVVRKKAEEIAAKTGVEVEVLMAEAEAIASGAWDTWSPNG